MSSGLGYGARSLVLVDTFASRSFVVPSRICSEARRHNALIRSSGLDEPLKPLLRPLQPSVEQDANKNKVDTTGILTPPSTAGSVASATASRTARPGAATSGLSLNTAVSPSTSMAVTAFQGSPASALSATGVDFAGLGRWDIVPPTPSPHFPGNIATLVSLTADKARALVRDYGIVRDDDEPEDKDENTGRSAGMVRGGKQSGNARGGRGGVGRGGRTQRPASMATTCSDASSWVNAGLDGTREDDLNKFMRYIGVGFQVLPSSPVAVGGGTGMMLQSPVVERRDCAFNR
ncbi:hypothetical protein LXA43DRAFT_1027675 [Ganoderma leucocontextum]|nr:hypothetical protein LXA43DRAFT_1027675 [Ganoderma leucocontextum]